MDIKNYMNRVGRDAREASRLMAAASTESKNQALLAIADALDAARPEVMAANQQDLAAGEKNGLDAPLMGSLTAKGS